MFDSYDNFNASGASHALPIDAPAEHASAITPSDTDDLSEATRALHVGVAGDVKVDMVGSGTVTFVSCQGILQVRVKKVYATGTDATNIIGLR